MNRKSHLGVYALINRNDNVALILKSRGAYAGSWDLPGGSIEFGESPMQALVREVYEETGLQVQTAALVDTLSARVPYKNSVGEDVELHHLGIIFTCEVKASEELRHTGDDQDASAARWVSRLEAQNLDLTPFARMLLVN